MTNKHLRIRQLHFENYDKNIISKKLNCSQNKLAY